MSGLLDEKTPLEDFSSHKEERTVAETFSFCAEDLNFASRNRDVTKFPPNSKGTGVKAYQMSHVFRFNVSN